MQIRKAIHVEHVSKQYRLGEVGTGALRDDIKRWWYGVRGKEDPFLKIGETNDRTQKSREDYVWALRDVNFDVMKGDVLGIIGKNGAGKSTLLKILSQTTTPTLGTVKMKGRIASLLEVGTGFHPELSGRENIFLNGAILGMRKTEIAARLDEIIAFSGVERYIDTPVKRYSSGMYVRLAFAVAAHLESEILIVDEVLAVGDVEFQKKCLGRMKDVSRNDGRTVLFVSHNMAGIKQLCTSAMVMDKGTVHYQGTVEDAVNSYLSLYSENREQPLGTSYKKESQKGKAIELLEAKVLDRKGNERTEFESEEDITITLRIAKNEHVPNTQGYLVIMDAAEDMYIESDTFDTPPNILDELPIGTHQMRLTIPKRILPNGSFIVYLNFTSEFSVSGFTLDSPKQILNFDVGDHSTPRGLNRKAKTNTVIPWNIIQHDVKS